MPAQSEEVVVHPDRFHSEDLLPNGGDGRLDVGARGDERGVEVRARVGRRGEDGVRGLGGEELRSE